MSVLELATSNDLIAPTTSGSTHWLQVISHLDPARGGMSAVVPRLASEIAANSGVISEIAVFKGNESPHPSAELVTSTWPASHGKWLLGRHLKREFEQMLRHIDGVHIHGLWETSTTVAARAARSLGKPYVLSAHGMLDPWALRNKAAKKRIYAALLENSNLQAAACLHALTYAEAEDYRRFGCTSPIAVIPNGVDTSASLSPALFLSNFPQLQDRKILLFLGRIHFKKGLDLLIPAWAEVIEHYPDACLVLAGPDSENSFKSIADLITRFGLSDRIVYTGMLDEPLKWSALAAASCFVLPSYSEGLSVAVLEAMSVGVPVIVSEQCHIPEVATSGAGLVVGTTIAAVANAIRDILGLDPSTRGQMGQRGQSLVKQQYSWPVVAEKMAALYGWVAGGPRPTTFEIEEVRL